MNIERYIDSLVSYAVSRGLAEPVDRQVLTNRLLDILRKDDYELSQESDTLATADYIFTPYSNSTFGYVITDMKFTQIGTLL